MSHNRQFIPPFDIPASWEWVSLGDYLINRDGERIPVSLNIRSKQTNKIYDYYGAVGVIDKVDNFLFNERLLLIGEDGANLISRAKDNAFFAEGRYWVNNHAHILDATDKSLLDFVALYINAIALDNYVTGSAKTKLSQDSLNRIQIPIPPYTEQIRILNSVQSYCDIIDFINHEKRDIQETLNLIKSMILDLAMQGKLVPQEPSDEPAADMLRRINPKAKIITDTPHYRAIPKNWATVSFTDVCNAALGKTLNKGTAIGEIHPYLCAINVKDGYFDLNTIKRTKILPVEFERYSVYKGVLLVCEGGDVGRCAIWQGDRIFYQNALHRIRPLVGIEQTFLRYFLLYAKNKHWIEELCSGVTIKHFTTKAMSTLVIAILSNKEQRRIIEKIENLFELLNAIEEELTR